MFLLPVWFSVPLATASLSAISVCPVYSLWVKFSVPLATALPSTLCVILAFSVSANHRRVATSALHRSKSQTLLWLSLNLNAQTVVMPLPTSIFSSKARRFYICCNSVCTLLATPACVVFALIATFLCAASTAVLSKKTFVTPALDYNFIFTHSTSFPKKLALKKNELCFHSSS